MFSSLFMANAVAQGLSHAHGSLEIFRLLHSNLDFLFDWREINLSAMKMTERLDPLTGSRCSSPFGIVCCVDKLGENKS